MHKKLRVQYFRRPTHSKKSLHILLSHIKIKVNNTEKQKVIRIVNSQFELVPLPNKRRVSNLGSLAHWETLCVQCLTLRIYIQIGTTCIDILIVIVIKHVR